MRDVDGDGVVSAEEIRTLAEKRRTAMVTRYDTDGELSRAERRAARDAQRDMIEARLDVDGDGTVSDAEGAGLDEARDERKSASSVVQDALRLAVRQRLESRFREVQGFWSSEAAHRGIASEADLERYLQE